MPSLTLAEQKNGTWTTNEIRRAVLVNGDLPGMAFGFWFELRKTAGILIDGPNCRWVVYKVWFQGKTVTYQEISSVQEIRSAQELIQSMSGYEVVTLTLSEQDRIRREALTQEELREEEEYWLQEWD